jgi:succinate-semialdehyde dehydrogenase/glutarate-semialdehyde dehydrogenase
MAIPTLKETVQTPAQTIPVLNPVTGQEAGRVPRCSPYDMTVAIDPPRPAPTAWAALPYRHRAAVMIRFHDLILRRSGELFDVLQSEAGKSRRDAFVELFAVACELRHYAYHGQAYLRSRRAKPAIPFHDRVRVTYQPLGVVGIISPWNVPFILSICDAIPALLAGNTVVVKPATLTPLSALWAREKLIECGLPPEVFQVVTGLGSELGNALIDKVDFVMFTGSTEIGKKVAERAAGRLIPYSLELGGKNALIVLPDAGIQHAARVTIEGSFNNMGQVCINFERAYVHSRVYDAFIEELVSQTERLRLGAGRDFSTDLGCLSSEEQLRSVEKYVGDATGKGARVLTGGKRRPDLGSLFYEPVILADVTPSMALHAEETFGPVLSVYRVEKVEEAIRQVNDSRYGLHAAVMSGSRERGEAVARQLQAGSVCVNDSYINWAVMDGPMGGFKESGVGRRHGEAGIRKFTEPQTIITNLTPWQISSYETALSINDRLAGLLLWLLRAWRYVPFFR